MNTTTIPESGGLTQREVLVEASALPLHCPTDAVKLWNAHPRVFLDVAKHGSVHCPYCGTHYRYNGPVHADH